MGMDTVATAVRSRYRNIDQFFCERVEYSGFNHHLFDARPCSLKKAGLVGESAPEIVHEVGLTGGADIVEHGFYDRDACDFLIAPELYGSHLVILHCDNNDKEISRVFYRS
jgi:hypothetical protein